MSSRGDHFNQKSVVEHLASARHKGALAIAEFHGLELSGSFFSFFDSLRDTAVICALCLLLCSWQVSLVIAACYSLWKPLRSALWGWNRLDRLHRLIEEERFEIEHNRDQEKIELTEMYQAKGFKSPLLEQVVATLMSDDNRLLQVMLEEEMGLRTEIVEHPLRQALGAFFGSCIAGIILFTSYFMISWALWIGFFALFFIASFALAKKLNIPTLSTVIWTLSSGAFVLLLAHFARAWFFPS